MARKAAEVKNVQVSATISQESYDALQELRWSRRVEKPTELVATAIEEYIARETAKEKASS